MHDSAKTSCSRHGGRGGVLRALATTLALFALIAPVAADAGDLPPFCDPGLAVNPSDPFAYAPRGEDSYCEGRYIDHVSGSSLTVASLEAVGSDELDRVVVRGALELHWSGNVGPLRLRVGSLQPRTFYRLDTERSDGRSGFSWTQERMKGIGVEPDELGAVGVRDREGETIYVPVWIAGRAGKRSSSPRLLVVPQKTVDEIYVSVSRLGADGKPEVLRSPTPLLNRHYAAGRPVDVSLEELDEAGEYRVKLGAVVTGGGTATHEIRILLPGA